MNNPAFSVAPVILTAGEPTFDIFPDSGGAGIGRERLLRGLYAPFPVIRHASHAHRHASHEQLTLVWGFSAVREAEAAGLAAVSCIEVPNDIVSALEIALEFERRPGGYTPAEQYAMWRLMTGSSEPVAKDRLARVGSLLGSSGQAFQALMRRFDALPDAVREAVLGETLDIKTAERCRDLPAACIAALSGPDYRAAGLSFSRTRQLLSLLREIWLRDNLSPAACRTLMDSAVADADPVAYLRRQRYPELVNLEQRFASLRRETTAGSGVELTAPPYFEGDSFELRFQFSSRAELSRRRVALQYIEDRFDEFLELL
ncbi:MAG: hypothetical protein LC641_01050 [Spirochaeta sp.]|nr:hypothetical protein [Spirochaeta sp.]